MFFIQAGNKINQNPDNKKNGKWNKVQDKPIGCGYFSKTNIERYPQRKNKEKYIATK